MDTTERMACLEEPGNFHQDQLSSLIAEEIPVFIDKL